VLGARRFNSIIFGSAGGNRPAETLERLTEDASLSENQVDLQYSMKIDEISMVHNIQCPSTKLKAT